MSRKETQSKPKGDVRFQQPPAKLVAARAEDEGIEALNKKLQDDDGFPHHCGGL
ncbi:hypothetical protein [Paenibacillus thermotolerans]|uniref:hypothetical protein n=1 Tax=Paenibacillus thermotolerans TaxID=3027807 RepID=UPI002367F20B|nr:MULTISPECIES: hypothetical protein [unclassified Paenibacillus]